MRYEAFRSLADKNAHVIAPEGAVRRHDHQPLRHLDVSRVLLRRLGAVPLPVARSYIRLVSGHLQPRPSVVQKGKTTKLYWNISNVSSCTVTRSNGNASGNPGKTSFPIKQQTVYSLQRTALDLSP